MKVSQFRTVVTQDLKHIDTLPILLKLSRNLIFILEIDYCPYKSTFFIFFFLNFVIKGKPPQFKYYQVN